MRIKTIEIRINGSESVKQDWSKHKIEVDTADAFNAMTYYGEQLANRLAVLGTDAEGSVSKDMSSEGEWERKPLLGREGTELKPGQIWVSADGEFESRIVGFNSQGFPVIEKLKGWDIHGYADIEKYWKSMFLHSLKNEK